MPSYTSCSPLPTSSDSLAHRFGADVASDRAKIAERVFGDEDARAWLEGLSGRWSANALAPGERLSPADQIAVVEVPLLFESGMEAVFDATIAVIADESTARGAGRGERTTRRSPSGAGRQLSQQEKADKADFTVRNDGSLEELKQTLSRVIAKLEPT